MGKTAPRRGSTEQLQGCKGYSVMTPPDSCIPTVIVFAVPDEVVVDEFEETLLPGKGEADEID
ncbi:MAG TPA: hypothetical protein VLY21_01230 [Nitrososphaerales archaeon]|nr:hypothetical protein [Nitrososphaerales archaeon]